MKNSRVFWGWYVVAGSFLLMAINYGSRYCFGVFVKPMSHEHSWSISAISVAASVYLFVYAMAAIAVGRGLDRMGPRWLALGGAILSAAGFLLASRASTPLELYLAYGILYGLGSVATGVVVCNPYVGKWFVRRRGLALGISTMGIGFGTVILSPIAGYIVKYHSWQDGFVFLGVVTLIVGVAVSQFLMRKSAPEAHGQFPDGEGAPPSCEIGPVANSGSDLRLADLMKDSRFYVLGIAHGLAVMAFLTVMMHQVAYAIDNGVEKIAAATTLGAVSIFGILGQFVFGWLSDRLKDPKYAACLGYTIMAAGMILLLRSRDVTMFYIFAAVYGFGYGSLAPMMPIMIADRFGRHVLGSVYGLLTFFTVGIMGSLGPFLGGLIYDAYGSYTGVWGLNLAMFAAAALFILALKPGYGERGC